MRLRHARDATGVKICAGNSLIVLGPWFVKLLCYLTDTHSISPQHQVNLLDDHLVDVLLDSAAGGWNTVEREAIPYVTACQQSAKLVCEIWSWIAVLAISVYIYICIYIHMHIHIQLHTLIHMHVYKKYMNTHFYLHVHLDIHKHIHTQTHMYIYTCVYTHIHMCMCIYMYIHTYIHTYMHAYIHTYVRTYIHTYIHTYIRVYTYIHACMHTYIHTYIHTLQASHEVFGPDSRRGDGRTAENTCGFDSKPGAFSRPLHNSCLPYTGVKA